MEDKKFNYQMLSRLKSDCDYFLGNGGRNERVLWAGSVSEQIAEMKKIWNSFKVDEKPEWLSMTDIIEYEKKMKTPIKNIEKIDDFVKTVVSLYIRIIKNKEHNEEVYYRGIYYSLENLGLEFRKGKDYSDLNKRLEKVMSSKNEVDLSAFREYISKYIVKFKK